jgi:hypothetical protein
MTTSEHDLANPLADKPYAELLASYCADHPLLGAYDAIVKERNTHKGSITEELRGGVDTRTASRMALQRLDMPCDELTVDMADAWVHRMYQEVGSLAAPEVPTISSELVGYFLPECGVLPTPEGWQQFDASERREIAATIGDRMTGEVWTDVLELVMPVLLEHVIDEDRRARRPLQAGKDADEEPRRYGLDWLGAAALDLPATPEGLAEGQAYVDGLVTDTLGPEGAATVLPKDGA